MAHPLVEVQDLALAYPGKKVLSGISFSMGGGEIVALLGPNGVGKTTLLHALSGLMRPVAGTVRIGGRDPAMRKSGEVPSFGLLSDRHGLYDDNTVLEVLRWSARSRGMRDTADAVEKVLDRCPLEHALHEGVHTLSAGWRQWLGIAQALIHNPRVLLLDEPASNLDPEMRDQLSDEIVRFVAETGATAIVSSHIVAELRSYAGRALVLAEGSLAADEKLAATDDWMSWYRDKVS